MKLKLLIFLFLTSISAWAQDDSASSRLEIDDVKPAIKGDLDKEVVDAKFRAQSGSKSRWSGSLSLNYNAANLEDPFGHERPNVANEGNPSPTYASGSVGLRYRIDKNRSYFLATGLFVPFEGPGKDQLEANTPMLQYNKTFAYEDLELSSSFLTFVHTQKYAREFGSTVSFSYDISVLSQIAQSRFKGGLSLSPFVNFYDRYVIGQSDYGFSLSPTLQYSVNDKLNLYTTVTAISNSHYRKESLFQFEGGPLTQSLGAGIAVFRNFYLSPSLFFKPDNLDPEFVAVNVSAYINLL